MKTTSSLVIALLAGCAFGAAGVRAVRAQAPPPALSIVEVDIVDTQAFGEFAKLNAAGVAATGGRFVVRRGRVVTSAGTPPKDVFVIAWDSLDQAVAYFNSPTFRQLIPLRDKAAKVRLFHVEGLPK